MPVGNGGVKLFNYFHQLFAQVTNPPIDPIREELVMSIMTYIGNQANILAETPEHARLVKMTRPVLTDDELKRMRNIPEFPARTLALARREQGTGKREQGTGNREQGWLKASLDALATDALAAVKDGAKIIILSDRELLSLRGEQEIGSSGDFIKNSPILPNSKTPSSESKKRIPSLLAVAAVNNALTEAGVRPSVGIVVESG